MRSKVAASLLACLAVGSAVAQQQRFFVDDLGLLPGGIATTPTRINSNGAVAGYVVKSFTSNAFRYMGVSGIIDLGVLPGYTTAAAFWINRAGTIFGTCGEGNTRKAFRWFNGAMTEAVPGVPTPTDGVGINDSGAFVVNRVLQGAPTAYTQGATYSENLPKVAATDFLYARAIDGLGQIVGDFTSADGVNHVFIYKPPQGTGASTLAEITAKRNGDTQVTAADIAMVNLFDSGQTYIACGTTGYFVTDSRGIQSLNSAGWVAPAGSPIYLPGLPNDNVTEARGINNNGNVVVGRSGALVNNNGIITTDWKGCIWLPISPLYPYYVPFNPNEFLPPTSNIKVDALLGLNDAGQMIGMYTQNGTFRGLRLTPVITPVNVSFVSPTVYGGDSTTGTVEIDGRPVGGLNVTLQSSSGIVQVPATVTVPNGQTSATFPVTTSPVSVSTPVTVKAIANGYFATGQIRVNPTVLGSISANPNPITGGLNSTGTVSLFGVAPSGGFNVALSSLNTALAVVPSSVTVPAGARNKTFTIQTAVVQSNAQVILRASKDSITRSVTLNITVPQLESVTLNPSTVLGGTTSTGTVKLTNRALSPGAGIALTSSSPSLAQVPASVSIPTGFLSTTFTITTAPTPVNVTVQISARFAAVTKSANLTIRVPALNWINVTYNPVLGGEQNSSGWVYLDGPAQTPAVIALSSSNAAAANVQSSVTIPTGAKVARYVITTGIIESTTVVTITATYLTVTKTTTIRVQAADLIANDITPNPVKDTEIAVGVVRLNRPAQAGGAWVFLSVADDTIADISTTTLFIPQGNTVGNYFVFPNAVGTTTITARRGASVINTDVTVIPGP